MNVKLSETSAKKLLFEGNESGCSSDENNQNRDKFIPLYKRVAGRKENSVFVPKSKNAYSQETFIKNLDLNKQIAISEEQEKKWSKQLTRMIESIHKDLKTDDFENDEKAPSSTFEQMLMSDDFFSFEAFNQCKKLSEQLRGKKSSSYRQIVQGALRPNVASESEFELETFDIDAQHDSDFIKTRKLTMDEPVKISQTSDEDRGNKISLQELE